MTNPGTELIRQDSILVLQSRKSVAKRIASSNSARAEPEAIDDIVYNKRAVSKEQGQRKPKSTLKGVSEPFPEDFTSTIGELRLDARKKYEVQRTVQDGTTGSIVPAEDVTSAASTDSEAIGSRRSRQQQKRKSLRSSSTTRSLENAPIARLSLYSPQNIETPMRPTSVLIASLGNPPPYQSTRHSAAHIILKHLQSHLGLPSFTAKSRLYGGGHVSLGAEVGRPELTLWQSPSLMNVSGPPLLKAWKHFVNVQSANLNDPITGLIVLHDEMETEPGKVKVKRGNTSPRGHNGIKSVQACFQGAGLMEGLGERYVKIGVGIGRPPGGSRDTRDVSAYVLGQLTARERDGLEDAATGELMGLVYQEMARMGGGVS